MKFYPEKEAEKFLADKGFSVIKTGYVPRMEKLKKVVENFSFPIVMKIHGKSIIHKGKIGGVKLGIKSLEMAKSSFIELSKIKGFEGVLIQEQYKGKKEFLLGVKKTPEFGHVVAFGTGGSGVEEAGDVYFRVCEFDLVEAIDLIKESRVSNGFKEKDYSILGEALVKICRLVKKNPKIKELDINPMILGKNTPYIVDARILFE